MNQTNESNVVDIRRYTVVTVEGTTQLACYTQGRWAVDATCETINQLLQDGLVSVDSIQGWIERRILQRT